MLLILSACSSTPGNQDEALSDKQSATENEIVPRNHRSTKKFSEYKNVFIKPLTTGAEYQDSNSNKEALPKINDLLYKNMLLIFTNLKEFKDFNALKPENTLIIEPQIVKMRVVSNTARMWVGVMAGNSSVILKVTYTDAATKAVIADPSFYQRAGAWAAAYSAGGHDQSMLSRIAELASFYASDNF